MVIEQELERERKELEKWQKYKVNEILFPQKILVYFYRNIVTV